MYDLDELRASFGELTPSEVACQMEASLKTGLGAVKDQLGCLCLRESCAHLCPDLVPTLRHLGDSGQHHGLRSMYDDRREGPSCRTVKES